MTCRGFTLAEVLITLGIIGVVAALTIPTLMQKLDERETVSKLKKFYSTIENASKMVNLEYGDYDKWGFTGSNDDIDLFWERYAKYLNIQQKTKISEREINENIQTYWLDGTQNSSSRSVILRFSDGMEVTSTWLAASNNSACLRYSICGDIKIDINGEKGPNTYGKDIFVFNIKKDGISPDGLDRNGVNADNKFENYCLRSVSKQNNGYGCAAWVIYKENMDYLHCDDLSWNGKTKCD